MPQLAMWNLLGVELPAQDGIPIAELVRLGHDDLVVELGIDFGYDVNQWHEYLSTFSESYRWADEHLSTFPAPISRAVSNPSWRDAIELLQESHADALAAVQSPE